MTRARVYALAVLVGVCSLGHASAFAQYGPPGPAPNAPSGGAGDSGYFGSPVESQDPAYPREWYGNADEVEASINRFGPQVYVNKWFLRTEYLNWNIGRPGNVLLGAPVSGIPDPSRPFVIFAPQTSEPIGFGSVPTTNPINLTSASGLQVTTGLQLIDGGQVEVSAFMLAKKQSGYTLPLGSGIDLSTVQFMPGSVPGGLPPFGPNTFVPSVIATSTLSNGQISDHLFLYNQSFTAIYTSQLWGAEANYLWGDAVDTFQFLPLAGARYINFTETLTQIGVFQDQFIPSTPSVSTQIGSRTVNNLWGGQVGFRAQVVTKYIEFGVTPKLLLLGDTAYSSVYAARFRSNSDPTVFNDNLMSKFTFGTDVGAFATVNIAPNFSIRGGYNILWINQVVRANRNITYNDFGPASPAGIGQQTVFHDVFINGFSFGAEFRF